jgi:2-polyprenyl-6-hydroxyphenyl methylase/3-demethylubiquinone-9 3-methyltransferase
MQQSDRTQATYDFARLAQDWWDLHGPCAPLHRINPLRVDFIKQTTLRKTSHLIDLGCGGGIFCEAIAREKHSVTGLDISPALIKVASEHAEGSGLSINYLAHHIIDYSHQYAGEYDVVTCLELLEHVDDPSRIVAAASRLCKKNGFVVLSTLNRNIKSFLLGIVAAEYVCGLIPKNTHQYELFIKPSELTQACRLHGLDPLELRGIHYNPLTKTAHINDDVSVNYILCCRKT